MKSAVFKTPPLKSAPAHFPAGVGKAAVPQLGKALGVCMLPISGALPRYEPQRPGASPALPCPPPSLRSADTWQNAGR